MPGFAVQFRAILLLIVLPVAGPAAMNQEQDDTELVLVAGATGRTGQLVVRELRDSGFAIRAFVRDAQRATQLLGPDIDYVQGDVRDAESVRAAMDGVDRLVSAIGATRGDPDNSPEDVDFGGVRTLAVAARAADLRQIVLVSSAGVTRDDHILNRLFGNVLVWKRRGEDAVRDAGVPYTIVRPGGLTDGEDSRTALVFRQGDEESGFVTRGDVARVCVAALRHEEALGKTFELFSGDEPAGDDWRPMFAVLDADGAAEAAVVAE